MNNKGFDIAPSHMVSLLIIIMMAAVMFGAVDEYFLQEKNINENPDGECFILRTGGLFAGDTLLKTFNSSYVECKDYAYLAGSSFKFIQEVAG